MAIRLKWIIPDDKAGVDPLIASMPKMTKRIERYLVQNYHKKKRGQMAEELGIQRFHLNMMTIRLKVEGKIVD